jgi:hypothetical protein
MPLLVMNVYIDGGESSTSRSGRFTPRERTPVAIDYKAGWDPSWSGRFEKEKKISCPYRIRTPDHPSRSYTDHSKPAPLFKCTYNEDI